jgi:hypothetical protein
MRLFSALICMDTHHNPATSSPGLATGIGEEVSVGEAHPAIEPRKMQKNAASLEKHSQIICMECTRKTSRFKLPAGYVPQLPKVVIVLL